MSIQREGAETVALHALAWLAGNDDLLPAFLDASGASESDIRDNAADPTFLGSVLDFIMMNDEWVIEFCDSQSLPYDRPMMARAALPGGAQTHWT